MKQKKSLLKKRSVTLCGHRTSVTLEEPFWQILQDIAQKRQIPLQKLIEEIDNKRQGNLSSALRLYVLEMVNKE